MGGITGLIRMGIGGLRGGHPSKCELKGPLARERMFAGDIRESMGDLK